MKLTVKALNIIGISFIVLGFVIFILKWFYMFGGFTLLTTGFLLIIIGQIFRAFSKRKRAKDSTAEKVEDSAQNWYNWLQ